MGAASGFATRAGEVLSEMSGWKQIVYYVAHALLYADYALIVAARACVRFADEWLSCPQIWIERGLIFAIQGPQLVVAIARPSWLAWLSVLMTGYWLSRRYDTPDALRMAQLASPIFVAWRLVFLLMTAFFLGLAVAEPLPRGWLRAARIGYELGVIAFVYVASLPRGGGRRRGRKRALALEKLKAMFGTSWMPVPARGAA
jgi:hypothetical protein